MLVRDRWKNKIILCEGLGEGSMSSSAWGSEADSFHAAGSYLQQQSRGNNQYSVDKAGFFFINISQSSGHLSPRVPRV